MPVALCKAGDLLYGGLPGPKATAAAVQREGLLPPATRLASVPATAPSLHSQHHPHQREVAQTAIPRQQRQQQPQPQRQERLQAGSQEDGGGAAQVVREGGSRLKEERQAEPPAKVSLVSTNNVRCVTPRRQLKTTGECWARRAPVQRLRPD